MANRIPLEEANQRSAKIGKLLVAAAEKWGFQCDADEHKDYHTFFHPDNQKISVSVRIKLVGFSRCLVGRSPTVQGLMVAIDKDYGYFRHGDFDGFRVGEKKFLENPDLIIKEVDRRIKNRLETVKEIKFKGGKTEIARAKIEELKAKYPTMVGKVSLLSDKQDITENDPNISIFASLTFEEVEKVLKALSSAPGGAVTETNPCGGTSRG